MVKNKKKLKTKRKPRLKIISNSLNNAIIKNDINKVNELLKKGIDVNQYTNVWCKPVIKNKMNRYTIKNLCSYDGNYNNKLDCGCGVLGTSIQLALVMNNKEIIHALLDHGVDLLLTHSSYNYSCLYLACGCGLDIVKKVYRLGDNRVNYIDMDGDSIVIKCMYPKYSPISKHKLSIIKFLVSKGANINYRDYDKASSLHHACILGHINIVKYLLIKGINVNYLNVKNRTALHETILSSLNNKCNKEHIIKLLIKHGANINTQTKDSKSTPLTTSVGYGLVNIVKLLLKNNANKKLKDNDNMTALDIAKSWGFNSIVKLLK
jgi:ankyrin repeat protein